VVSGWWMCVTGDWRAGAASIFPPYNPGGMAGDGIVVRTIDTPSAFTVTYQKAVGDGVLPDGPFHPSRNHGGKGEKSCAIRPFAALSDATASVRVAGAGLAAVGSGNCRSSTHYFCSARTQEIAFAWRGAHAANDVLRLVLRGSMHWVLLGICLERGLNRCHTILSGLLSE